MGRVEWGGGRWDSRAQPRSGFEPGVISIVDDVCMIVDYSSSGAETGWNWEMGIQLGG